MCRLMNAMFGIDRRFSEIRRADDFIRRATPISSPYRAQREITPIPRVNPGLSFHGPLGRRPDTTQIRAFGKCPNCRALRARLRSHRPSGTKTIREHCFPDVVVTSPESRCRALGSRVNASLPAGTDDLWRTLHPLRCRVPVHCWAASNLFRSPANF
jgi:hypothetical protein